MLLLCIVTFYQVVITLCKGVVDSIIFVLRVSRYECETADIRNDGLECECYLEFSQRSLNEVRSKVYHSSVGV